MTNWNPLEKIRSVQVEHHDRVEVTDFPRIEKVIKGLSSISPGILLDVGYSKGSFSDSMVDSGWTCIGLDLNKHSSGKVRSIQCDVNFGFPIETASIDAITAGEIIEHVLGEGAFLEECRRVLKPGGALMITTPNLVFWVNRVRMLAGMTPLFVYAPYHYHFHTRKTIEALLGGHGFDVTGVISSHVLFSRRRHPVGKLFEWLGDLFPSLGAHLIVFSRKR